jgi:hypothetical protein
VNNTKEDDHLKSPSELGKIVNLYNIWVRGSPNYEWLTLEANLMVRSGRIGHRLQTVCDYT